ncbi:MAG: helix-turn-helix domain-containing protein [Elusimicrobia bacterium]|nr:helix-turn-helix domain-containing protein [Elusimicrobiota bacterium]
MPTMKKRRKTVQRVYDGTPPEVMDIKALAQYLGLGRSKIYALIRERKVPASRIGRQYRFSKALVDAWLKERLITRSEESQYTLFPRQK